MIPQRNISRISNITAREGKRRIPENVIERDYCLSWFLFGLAHNHLKEELIFKGGTALRRCYFKDYRFSEDLDFTLRSDTPLERILQSFEEIFRWVNDESGIKFELGKIEDSHINTHTFYINYLGPLPGGAKDTKVDVTFIETILYPVEEKQIIRTYDEYSDFLEKPTINVYSLNEVVLEKVCALFTRSRNEPRDLYDIFYLITETDINISMLALEIDEKMTFKGSSLKERSGEFERKEKGLRKMWTTRLQAQVASLPAYEDVFRKVKRAFRQAGLL